MSRTRFTDAERARRLDAARDHLRSCRLGPSTDIRMGLQQVLRQLEAGPGMICIRLEFCGWHMVGAWSEWAASELTPTNLPKGWRRYTSRGPYIYGRPWWWSQSATSFDGPDYDVRAATLKRARVKAFKRFLAWVEEEMKVLE